MAACAALGRSRTVQAGSKRLQEVLRGFGKILMLAWRLGYRRKGWGMAVGGLQGEFPSP